LDLVEAMLRVSWVRRITGQACPWRATAGAVHCQNAHQLCRLSLPEARLTVSCPRVCAPADKQRLPITQQEASNIRGWAVEARIYAEDPARQFMPSPGTLKRYKEPSGDCIR